MRLHELGQAKSTAKTWALTRVPDGYSEIFIPAEAPAGSVLKVGDHVLVADQDVIIGGQSAGKGSMVVRITREEPDRFIVAEVDRTGALPSGFVVDYLLKANALTSNISVYRSSGFSFDWGRPSTWLPVLLIGGGVLAAGVFFFTRKR